MQIHVIPPDFVLINNKQILHDNHTGFYILLLVFYHP